MDSNHANKITTTIYVLIVVLAVLVFITYNNINKTVTEKTYLVNNYLYIFIGLLLMTLFSAIFDKYKTLDNLTVIKLFAIFILSLFVLFGLIFTPTQNIITKHLLWVGFLLILSVITYGAYKIALESDILPNILITSGVIVAVMSYVALNTKPEVFDSMGYYLFIGLLALIIFQLVDIIFASPESLMSRNKIYGFITVILFSGFLIYDTQQIRQMGHIMTKVCNGSLDPKTCVDYPTQSLSLILDIVNLFTGLTRTMQEK
jgi:FtsH-binding integral membrane protein